VVTDVYEKASKEWGSVFQIGKNNITINTESCDLEQLVNTLMNIDYFSKAVNKLSTNLWELLLVKACSPCYSIEISGLLKKEPIDLHVDPRYENFDRDSIPVRDRDPDNMDSNILTGERANNFPGLIVMKAVKLEHPTEDVDKVFHNITGIISIFCNLFSGNVSYLMSSYIKLSGFY